MVDRTVSPTLCIVLSEHLTNHYAGPLARGAAYAATALGYRLIIYSLLDINLTRRDLTLDDLPLLPQCVDGYILPGFVEDELIAHCHATGAALLTYAGKHPGIPSIGPDNRAGARAAVAHLIAHGRRRIVHLLGVEGNDEANERHEGYRQALAEAEIPYDPTLVVPGNFRLGDSQIAVAALSTVGVTFDAIFAANDLSARGAMIALENAGLRVPEDVALVGFDDAAGSEALVPPLTTIRQSAFQIGWDAVVALGRHRLGIPLMSRVMVPIQLVLRESCGCRMWTPSATADWVEQVAARLGINQGPIVRPTEVTTWLAPLDQALDQPQLWMRRLDIAIAQAQDRCWYVPALRDYLPVWRAHQLAQGADPAMLDDLISQAKDRFIQTQEARYSRERLEREDRLNALTYLIDLLREYHQDEALEIAMRHLVHSGAHSALTALQAAAPNSNITAQRVHGETATQHWQGSIADFPPAMWLAPGDTLLLMPLSGRTRQHGLIGLVERDALTHIDLDDLVLRSINTYCSITLLNETLRELEIARTVQRSLLPPRVPQHPDFDIAGASYSARQVGGDLYGYYLRPDGRLALAVGDVVGKGMPAALLMSACVTTLAGMIKLGLGPGPTLSQTHLALEPYMGHTQYAAICLAYLDGALVRVANAGAIAPLLRARTGTQMLQVSGLPLGTPLSDSQPYGEIEVQLSAQDMLILSSDGIVEACNAEGELYGFGRLVAAISAGPTESAEAMLIHLFAEVTAFIGEAETRDDMTIVVARYHGT